MRHQLRDVTKSMNSPRDCSIGLCFRWAFAFILQLRQEDYRFELTLRVCESLYAEHF